MTGELFLSIVNESEIKYLATISINDKYMKK